MKKLFRRGSLIAGCIVSVSFVLVAVATAAVDAHSPSPKSFTGSWIRTTSVTLPNGDEADVHFPHVPALWRKYFTDAFPVVAVLQGAQVDKKYYENFGRQLARQGFVVVIPNHFQAPPPPAPPFPLLLPDQFVIVHALNQMKKEDTDPQSPLYGIVDTERMGVTGHSFGGVVGLFAIDERCQPPFCFGPPVFPLPKEVGAGVFYGTNTCNVTGEIMDERCDEGRVIDIETGNIPVALVQGLRDGLAKPAEAEATFAVLDGRRALIRIDGANHYGICDENNPSGAQPDVTAPTLRQEQATARVAHWTGLWLRAHLRKDPFAKFWLYKLGGSLDEVVIVETD